MISKIGEKKNFFIWSLNALVNSGWDAKLYKIASISLCTASLFKWVTPEFWLQNEPPQLWVTCTKPRKSIWLCKQWALTHFHTLTQCTQCALTHAVQGNGGPPITDSVGVHICIFEFRIGICSYFDRNIFQYWPSLFFYAHNTQIYRSFGINPPFIQM